jgi:RNA polymerase sigma-70 factor (ECF subfamily)
MTSIPLDGHDLAFVAALFEGEHAAVLEFDRRCRPIIRHAFGRAYSRWRPERPVEADDYVQDFIGFLFEDQGRRLRSFAGKSRFTSWLYTVALRYFHRAMSKVARDRRSRAVLTLLPDPQQATPEHDAQVAQDSDALWSAVGRLSPSDQLYVRLFFVEGLNATEVAATLGKGTSAVRMKKMRVMEKLRELLEEDR